MTAMHATTSTEKHVARHAAVKETSTRRLPALRLPKLPKRSAAPKITVRNAVTGETRRVTPTGHALFVVADRGLTDRTLFARTAGGFATFADTASTAIDTAFPNHWIVQLFENDTQRKQRVNAQAVSHVLGLVAAVVTKRVK